MTHTLTKADIVDAVYEKTGRKRQDVKKTVDGLLDLMRLAVKKDRELLISGFGKFEVCDKRERRGRNPHTDEPLMISSRKIMAFRLSRKFRAELNGETA
ncbi:integration host factor subunit alpha [uncultured Desulfovibrio sp.]|uniref:integration host factor subunit alpha n=1 Tax=uncultured Desulfovibrio sp. TaxID=167968 RepID=UPI002617384E|nr:integration host factor subunit alpha [uncultured Desulfovibrio sp.]